MLSRRMVKLVLGSLLCVVALAAVSLFAQTESGLINGTVTDQVGGVVPNAKVTSEMIAKDGRRHNSGDDDIVLLVTGTHFEGDSATGGVAGRTVDDCAGAAGMTGGGGAM